MSDTLSASQMECAFSGIAAKAANARRVLFEVEGSLIDDPATSSALVAAAVALLEQIGWAADRHGGGILGDADKWMMPPVWHSPESD